MKFLAFLAVLCAVPRTEAGLFKRVVLKLDVIRGYCDEFGVLPSGMENITLRTDRTRKTLIDCLYVLRENLTSRYEEEIKITKCNSKESPDSCLSFKTLKFPDVCPLYLAKNQIWSTFFDNLYPKLTCPMRKGIYVMKGGFFDTTKMPIIVDPKNDYWKIHVQNRDLATKAIVFCIELEGQFVPMKSD